MTIWDLMPDKIPLTNYVKCGLISHDNKFPPTCVYSKVQRHNDRMMVIIRGYYFSTEGFKPPYCFCDNSIHDIRKLL
jgi:hypothetical protein